MLKVCFLTLGCKVNQQETAAMQQLFGAHGYEITAEGPADVYIVNSCTVTAAGDKKSLQWLRRAKRENPAAVTVLCGCYPQAFPDKAAAAGADIVVGNTQRGAMVALVERFMQQRTPIRNVAGHTAGELFEELPPARLEGRTRAFLKVEDGCDRACAYCIIPTARGPVRSRPLDAVLREVTALAADGCREFVLSGINLSRYGTDLGYDLADLVKALADIPDVARLRLGSIEPDLISEDVWRRLAAVPKLCPQFHLSLQSGADATLRRMGRFYTAADYAGVLALVRTLFDAPAFTTDVIVGFPGETDADFEESLRFVQNCRFLRVHVFSYSPRPGTAAADFGDQIPPQVKAARSRRMSEAAAAAAADLLTAAVGGEDEVLLERPDADGRFTGYTRRYMPVLVSAPGHAQGDVVPVRLVQLQNGRLLAAAPD